MTDFKYPIAENAQLVQEGEIRAYIEMLFGNLFYKPHHFICVRGIGEKGVPAREGKHQEDMWLQPGLHDAPDEYVIDAIVGYCETWAQYHIASFIVPCVLGQARGTSEAVELFTAIQVDLDAGDTAAKAGWLQAHLGEPSMVVHSGGMTEAGLPKLHVYYALEEPTSDIHRITELRHMLAVKAGGDLQFGRGTPDNPLGRAHQPIRIPGSVHAKGGHAAACKILHDSGLRYDIDILQGKLTNAPAGPWAPAEPPATPEMVFGPARNQRPDIAEVLTSEIHEGGDEDRSRWSELSKVFGHHIHTARMGAASLQEAKDKAFGWALAMQKPPFPPARLEREWNALVNRDMAANGPFPQLEAPQPLVVNPELGLLEWATHRWSQGKPPARQWVVRGLLLAGKHHLLVAEGGAGKTYAMLELALKVASNDGQETDLWFGEKIETTGTAVVITTEDDADELHIRLSELDPEGRRFKAGDRLIVVPTINAGGSFPLVERDRFGKNTTSPRWGEFMSHLEKVQDLKLVVIDTLNSTMHGDENSATVINEYVRALSPVCGKMGAALVVTHHIRKQGEEPIKGAEDMAAAVRGSSAIGGAFRAVLGIWHAHDFKKRMHAMGLKPEAKACWRLSVLKANNPEMLKATKTLLRDAVGKLVDATAQDRTDVEWSEEKPAWLLAAIRMASEAGYPYLKQGKNGASGAFGRRHEMHPMLRDMGWRGMEALLDRLLREGKITLAAGAGSRARNIFDVPGGPYATNTRGEDQKRGAWDGAPDWERDYELRGGEVVAKDKGPQMQLGGLNK